MVQEILQRRTITLVSMILTTTLLLAQHARSFCLRVSNSNGGPRLQSSFLRPYYDGGFHPPWVLRLGLLRRAAATTTTTSVVRQEEEEEIPPGSSKTMPTTGSSMEYHGNTTTMYTIDCPATDPETLRNVVTKHCLSLDQFLKNKPIAAHTIEAFSKVLSTVPPNATIILDSGCGTGRSTRRLSSLYNNDNNNNNDDNTWVFGIDRSLVRLERNRGFRNQQHQQQQQVVGEEEKELVWQDSSDSNASSSSATTSSSTNALWIRAELVDFWRLLLQHKQQQQRCNTTTTTCWNIQSHYMLYPNPYPKTKRFKSRWYGHPSFPLLLQVGGEKIILRSNWLTYLEEFAQAVIIADDVWTKQQQQQDLDNTHDNSNSNNNNNKTSVINYARPYVESAKEGPIRCEPVAEQEAWTNFERKFLVSGEPTYELVLTRQTTYAE